MSFTVKLFLPLLNLRSFRNKYFHELLKKFLFREARVGFFQWFKCFIEKFHELFIAYSRHKLVAFAIEAPINPKLTFLLFFLQQAHRGIHMIEVIPTQTKDKIFVCFVIYFCEHLQCWIRKRPPYYLLLDYSLFHFLCAEN